MRIIVNHLGRLFHPRMVQSGVTTILRPGTLGDVLIAGVTLETSHAVVVPRPLEGRLTVDDLTPNGGDFQLGAVVDLRGVRPGYGMEFETHSHESVEVVERWDDERFWAFNASLATTSLAEIFGHRLEVGSGRGVFLPSRRATRRIGVLEPRDRPLVYVNDRGSVRCELRDPQLGLVRISVSDHRFFKMSGSEVEEPDIVKRDVVDAVNQRILSGVDVLIGLCVYYVFPAEHPHQWLTVCGVHLRDDLDLGELR